MWGRKRQINRSVHQRYALLNVDLPVEKVRQQRIRWAIRTAGCFFGLTALFLGVWCGASWVMRTGFYQNDRFNVRQIDIHTDGVVKTERIRSWARVQEGENLFSLDLHRVKRDLEMVPIIEKVAVDRALPGTLRLRVTERKPLARVIIYKQYQEGELKRMVYWIDGNGVLISLNDVDDTDLKASGKWLPLITGLNQADLMTGRPVISHQLKSSLSLIDRFDLSPMAGLAHLRQIDVSRRETLQVMTWQGGRITLALNGLDRQLRRWRQIYDLGRDHQRSISSADLSIKNNLPVQWRRQAALKPRS